MTRFQFHTPPFPKALLAAVVLTQFSSPAFAQANMTASSIDETDPVMAAPAVSVPQDAPPEGMTTLPFAVSPIDDATLRSTAGREDVAQHAQADLTASVSSNSVGDGAITGDARIADNAFQNMSGLSILNVNTGNNVAINAAMNVNIVMNPGT